MSQWLVSCQSWTDSSSRIQSGYGMSKNNLLNSNTPVAQFARERMADRKDQIERGISAKPSGLGPERRDFLSRFIDARGKDPEFISEQRVLALTVANMFAGSDTTAMTLRAIFYNLLRSPSAMSRLLAELAAESESGRFTENQNAGPAGLVRWNEVRELPYLSAVINEALRCHPAAGLPLGRVVPTQGLRIDGNYIP
ncbi:putative pisatin demethylase [Diaporthe ampelina]|uniref:Putative pisatin demethylase n=1 Tax=Diaporthe ampelina TaxID=1214573 RepID=A0A0G2I9P0_9PEZI|nr:putative pisatin demethylase [Diaporthe ampelina]